MFTDRLKSITSIECFYFLDQKFGWNFGRFGSSQEFIYFYKGDLDGSILYSEYLLAYSGADPDISTREAMNHDLGILCFCKFIHANGTLDVRI